MLEKLTNDEKQALYKELQRADALKQLKEEFMKSVTTSPGILGFVVNEQEAQRVWNALTNDDELDAELYEEYLNAISKGESLAYALKAYFPCLVYDKRAGVLTTKEYLAFNYGDCYAFNGNGYILLPARGVGDLSVDDMYKIHQRVHALKYMNIAVRLLLDDPESWLKEKPFDDADVRLGMVDYIARYWDADALADVFAGDDLGKDDDAGTLRNVKIRLGGYLYDEGLAPVRCEYCGKFVPMRDTYRNNEEEYICKDCIVRGG